MFNRVNQPAVVVLCTFLVSISLFGSQSRSIGSTSIIRTHPANPFHRVANNEHLGNVEHLTGDEARRYLANLRSQHHGVFERAADELRRRGYRDTGDVEVIRTIRTVGLNKQKGRGPYRLADTSSGSEGEIVYWSWDDGDATTWEGSIYLHEYSADNWISADCQTFVDEGREWNLIWDYVVDAGGPAIERGPKEIDSNKPESATPFLRVSSRFTRQSDILPASIDWGRVQNKVQDWSWCTAFGCAGTTYTCWQLAPTPREKTLCAAATCIGIGIGCLGVLVN